MLLRIGLERTKILTSHWLYFRGRFVFVVEMIGSSYGAHYHVAVGVMWHLVFFFELQELLRVIEEVVFQDVKKTMQFCT